MALNRPLEFRHDLIRQKQLRVTLFALSTLVLLSTCIASQAEADALMKFKQFADPSNLLGTIWGDGDPCTNPWVGVKCSNHGTVQQILLANIALSGTFEEDTLSNLLDLRLLLLTNTSLRGNIPNLAACLALAFVYLNQNSFTGSIPDFIPASRHLREVDLSFNNLSGSIPASLSSPKSLSKVFLHNNALSGNIPNLEFNTAQQVLFNVANNLLTGPIPSSLSGYPTSSFIGNAGLCGPPLEVSCPRTPPLPSPASKSTPVDSVPPSVAIAPSSPGKSKKLSTGVIVAIVVGDVVLLFILTLFFLCYYWRKYSVNVDEKPTNRVSDEKSDTQSAQFATQVVPETERNKLVFFQGSQHAFDLEDLLRASAEMLGKGSFGTAYKAVLESGMIVAVKRLRDVRDTGKKDFEQQMELLGKLRHPNIVPLRAFYYAREEKLLVYDFMANGSLFAILHGNRGPGRTPLDWTSRLRIARGVAIGLAYIHQECESQKLPHGNIKSSNILLGKNYEVCISDFGLVPLMSPVVAAQRMAGYRAPEYSHSKKISQRVDVYSFGVLLLELLTGRQPAQSVMQGEGIDLPRWVHSVVREEWTAEVFDLELKSYRHGEEEMVSLLQIAMVCVEPSPEKRPRMSQVVKMIEDIRGADSFIESESFESHSEDFASKDSPFNL